MTDKTDNRRPPRKGPGGFGPGGFGPAGAGPGGKGPGSKGPGGNRGFGGGRDARGPGPDARGKPGFGARPDRDGPRQPRPSGDRPRQDGPRQERPYGDRPRHDGPRPERPYGDRPRQDGPRQERPYGDRPRQDGPRQPRPYGDRPRSAPGGHYGDARPTFGARPRPENTRGSYGDRSFARQDRARPERSRPRPQTEPVQRPDGRERLAKVMARAGVASRRDAEVIISAGRVSVNGKVVDTPAINVGPQDRILIDNKPMPARERTRLWLYNKPAGLVTTQFDPEGRPTVFQHMPLDLPHVISVGRLDINTEGLLLVTNDGGLARVLAHPETGWLRRYRVRAYGHVTPDALAALEDGVTVDGVHYGPVQATIQRQQGHNIWLMLGLREGKNREVKRILEHLGLRVNRLIRISFGPFQLGDIPEGEIDEVRLSVLKSQLGDDLALRAGADFESPVHERALGEEPRERLLPPRIPHRLPEEDMADPSFDEGIEAEFRDALKGKPWRDEAAAGAERPRAYRPERHYMAEEPVKAAPAEPQATPDPWRPSPDGPSPAKAVGSRLGLKRSTWRDADTEAARTATGSKKPRRGDDAASARAEAGQRAHVRAGSVSSPGGRKVLVEKVVRERRDDTPIRHTPGVGRDSRRGDAGAGWNERNSRGDRPSGHTPRGRPPFGDRQAPRERTGFGDRSGPRERPAFGDRPQRQRFDGPGRERPAGGRPFGDRPFGDRAASGKSFGGKSFGGKPFGDRPSGGGPGGPRSLGAKSFGGKPAGGKPFGGRPSGGKPGGGKPFGGKPGGGKPFGKPGGGRGGSGR